MPALASFLNLLIALALVVGASWLLRSAWVRAAPPRALAWLVAPGVAVHELSHAAACVLTGAKVHSLTLFRPDGSGEVRHGPPKLRYIGEVLIGLAPLAGGTSCLWLLDVLLGSPVSLYSVSADGVHADQFGYALSLLRTVWDDLFLAADRAVLSDWRIWVFLYFAFCFTLTMAPSRQDLRNASVGLLILAGLALVAHLVVDRLVGVRGDAPVFRFVGTLLAKLHYPLAVIALSFILCGVVWLAGIPFRGGTRPRRRRRG